MDSVEIKNASESYLNHIKYSCRICLQPEFNVVLSDLVAITRDLQKQFFEITFEKLCITRDLPYNVCKSCIDRIQSVREYQESLRYTQRNLSYFLTSKGKRAGFKQHLKVVTNFQQQQEPNKQNELAEKIINVEKSTLDFYIERLDVKEETLDEPYEEVEILDESEPLSGIVEKMKFETIGSTPKVTKSLTKKPFEQRSNCPKCAKTNVTQHHLDMHDSGPVQCQLCPITCSDQVTYRTHLAHHKQSEKIVTCEHCGLQVAYPKMRAHQDTHIPKEERQMKCQFCEKAFLKSHHLRNHQVRVHFKNREFQCEFCEQAFMLAYDLTVHRLKAHLDQLPDQERPKLECDCCDKLFKNQKALNTHKTLVNREKTSVKKPKKRPQKLISHRQLNCDFCGIEFETKEELQVHRREHRIVCSVCNKDFLSKQLHDLHKARHEIENYDRPYKCTISGCTAHFRKPYLLQIHKRFHTGERPYPCHLCEHAFRTHSDLRKHLLGRHKDDSIKIVHKTKEGSYKCELCSEKFQLRRQLNLHQRKVHDATKYYECQLCDKKFTSAFTLRYHYRRCQKNSEQVEQQPQMVGEEMEEVIVDYEINESDIDDFAYDVEYLEETLDDCA